MNPLLISASLLVCRNVFMSIAWYAHLKNLHNVTISACFPVIPAQAGIQRQIGGFYMREDGNRFTVVAVWIPAYAGET